jgi:hypothetical protein
MDEAQLPLRLPESQEAAGSTLVSTLAGASLWPRRLQSHPVRRVQKPGRSAVWIAGRPPHHVIDHGQVVQPAVRTLGLRRSELDHAIRSQHGDDLDEIEHGELTPSGRIVLTLKSGEQSSTKADIAELNERSRRVLPRSGPQRRLAGNGDARRS